MRVLVVGDTHADLEWVRTEVIPAAAQEGCDTIMQLGDFGFVWHNDIDKVDDALEGLSRLLVAAGQRVVWLPGNHENHPMLATLCRERPQLGPEMFFVLAPAIHYTGRVATWTWAGRHLFALGGATSIDAEDRTPGVSWWPEEKLTQQEARRATRMMRNIPADRVDVLFSHDGPIGVPFNLIPDDESALHRSLITSVASVLRPRRWYHGHYHAYAAYRHLLPHGEISAVTALACNNRIGAMTVLDLEEPA